MCEVCWSLFIWTLLHPSVKCMYAFICQFSWSFVPSTKCVHVCVCACMYVHIYMCMWSQMEAQRGHCMNRISLLNLGKALRQVVWQRCPCTEAQRSHCMNRISLLNLRKALRQVVWQEYPCMEAQRGPCVKLWQWSLDCLKDSRMLEMPGLWNEESC